MIVVARGGGSVADLAAFDDEELCRIAARNPVPIVAAVGHTANRPVIYQVAELTASVPREVGLVVVPGPARARRCARPRLRATACAISAPSRTAIERLAALSRRRALQPACLDPRSHALAAGGRRLDDFTRDFHARRLEEIAAATERRHAAMRNCSRSGPTRHRECAPRGGDATGDGHGHGEWSPAPRCDPCPDLGTRPLPSGLRRRTGGSPRPAARTRPAIRPERDDRVLRRSGGGDDRKRSPMQGGDGCLRRSPSNRASRS